MQKITPFLWFDTQAEEAVNHYVSIFPGSSITFAERYGDAAAEAAGRPQGSVMVMGFELAGQRFMALNGGPVFKFNESISFLIDVEDQEELDRINALLIEGGGQQSSCGWVKDKFGLSWQLVPAAFGRLMGDPEPGKKERVMAALMQMTKIDIETLEKA